MPPQKNLGILVAPPRPTDYILGSTSKIVIDRVVKDWSIYLPAVETQRTKVTDMLDCVSMSGPDHCIATQMNYLMGTNQLSDEALNFFHNNNYIVDGIFSLSARFSACLNGTEKTKGQYLNVAADCVRRDGVAPELLWPAKEDMTWEEFYKLPDASVIALAKKFLWFVNVQWEWVPEPKIKENLNSAPVQIASEVCTGWDSGQVVPKCSGQPLQHATMLYGCDMEGNWCDLDHYAPYKQKLAPDYELPLNLRYVVTAKPLTLRNGMNGGNVKQLQADLNHLGFLLDPDGSFGPKTEMQVKSFQNKTGLRPDGVAGPKTLAKLKELSGSPSVKDTIMAVATAEGVEPELALAVAQCESGLNPQCINQNTDKLKSKDRGLFQWNDVYHPEINDEMAFDPATATRLFCKAVKEGNLHRFWSASEPRWKKLLSDDVLKKYQIIN